MADEYHLPFLFDNYICHGRYSYHPLRGLFSFYGSSRKQTARNASNYNLIFYFYFAGVAERADTVGEALTSQVLMCVSMHRIANTADCA